MRSHEESIKRRRTAEYRIWIGLRNRCKNPTNPSYSKYGGRGIYVCERWDSYENFLDDMGRRPSKNHSIDRIDNDGPYSPENCRWATTKQQRRNSRQNNYITYQGITLTVTDWAEKVGISKYRVYERLKRGWTVEQALEIPTSRKSHVIKRVSKKSI